MLRLEASSDVPGDTSGLAGLQQEVVDHLRVIGNEMAKTEKSFRRGRISSWSRSMGELARFLDSVKGRKHVVYFSEGFDGRLLLGRQPSAEDREVQEDLRNITTGQLQFVDTDNIYGNTGLQVDMALMLEQFRRADVVIEAVDIAGLRADLPSAERAHNVGQDALFYLADDTGGNLYQDANDFGVQLGRIMERSSVTYLLSFKPDQIAYDGAYHRLKVKTDAPGRLVAREGYYAPRPWEELHPFEKGLIASGAIASAEETNAIALNVLAAPFRAGPLGAYVPVIIEVEGDTLLEGLEGSDLPVELYTYATNGDGEMKDFFTQMVALDVSSTREAFGSSGLKYYGHLELTPGDYLLRVLVRNAKTGRSGLSTVPLHVPTYDDQGPILLPPFFVENARRWFMVRETTPGNQPSVVYPFTVNGEPYVPAAKASLTERDEARLCLVAYNLSSGGTVDVAGTVTAQDGSTVSAFDLTGLERTVTGIDGLDKFLATFRTDGLSEGDYTLQVAMTDPVTGAQRTNSIPFSVY
ncbi:MAG: VWA domain-containing protein [Thermoanaerobaculia bacterium]